MSKYYVYMLRCMDDSIYTGITTDVERRFAEHMGQNGKEAKYTRVHKPKAIEKVFICETRVEASKLEYKIKKLKRCEKEELIKSEI